MIKIIIEIVSASNDHRLPNKWKRKLPAPIRKTRIMSMNEYMRATSSL
tara:strand:- start:167 stop:310 length:144 start_codon:yes stop_codon:yes gene_type:complete